MPLSANAPAALPWAARLEWRFAGSKPLAWLIDYTVHRPRRVLGTARWARRLAADDLARSESKTYSQFGEDGILAEIFRRVGEGGKYAVEFGVGDGSECCTRNLFESRGWGGALIEGSERDAGRAAERYARLPAVRVRHSFITVDNVLDLFASLGVPAEPDLLVVDIDGNDYWILDRVLTAHRPRVVCVEYNGRWTPPTEWVMPYDPQYGWAGSVYFGASLESLTKLGARHGYALVGCTSMGLNAFFVRDDVVGGHFPTAGRGAAYHYAPPRYGRGFGHPVRMRVAPAAATPPPA